MLVVLLLGVGWFVYAVLLCVCGFTAVRVLCLLFVCFRLGLVAVDFVFVWLVPWLRCLIVVFSFMFLSFVVLVV